jgi:hypothetical protein
LISLRGLGLSAASLRRRKATAVLTHYHFDRGGSRYRARVVPYPLEDGEPKGAWVVSIDSGPEHPVCKWRETDQPGPELEERLADGLMKEG